MMNLNKVWAVLNIFFAFGIIVFSAVFTFATEKKLESLTLLVVGMVLMTCSYIYFHLLSKE